MPPEYPYVGIRFEVTVDGSSLGSFSECSGLKVEVGSEDYHEGGTNDFVYKLPTGISHPPIVLKRGLSASKTLSDWLSKFATSSQVELKTVQIELNRPDGSTVRSWVVKNAYPLKWEGPTLNAVRGEVAFETLELAHQGLTDGGS